MSDADVAVHSLCDEVWKWRLEESPELASYCGFHQYDDRWDDVSEEAYIRREKCVQQFLKKAESLDPLACSPEMALSYTLLVDELKLYLQGAAFKSYLMPINYIEGVHSDVNMSISFMKFDSENDFNKYISRLETLPQRIEQVITILKKGIEEGIVQFASSVRQVPVQIDRMLNMPLDKLGLLKPFSEDHPNVDKEKLAEFENRAKDLISSNVFPAFRDLKIFLEEQYSKHTRPKEGINSLKNGAEWYQQCLDLHLSCSMTPQQIHDIGLNEVTRIHKQILDVAEKEGLGKTCPDILAAIRKRQENYFTSGESVLDFVKDLCHNKIRPKLSKMFKELPDTLSIQPVPEFMKDCPLAFYINGSPDGTREGCYFVNTHKLKAICPYLLPAVSLHEGEPGHHLQAWFAISSPGLPDFRRYSRDTKYYLAPAKFPFNTAYIEGWGLYSEALGEELNMYEDNMDLLGRYSFEIFRASRLVVDTGIHAFGWSKEQAVKYMVDHTLSPESELVQEVERYITWPGQACAYKFGELKFWELRRKAEKELGNKFDLKEFHSCILACGAVPLRVLEEIVDQYIAKTKECSESL